MTRALEQAGLEPSAIDYIKSHSTSHPVGDGKETKTYFKNFL